MGMSKKGKVLLGCFLMFSTLSQATVYEDAENGKIDAWRIVDNTPSGASIKNIEIDANRVIQLSGDSTRNAFMIGGESDDSSYRWRNTTEFDLSLKIKFDRRYYLYVAVETKNNKEIKFIRYSSSDDNEEYNSAKTIIKYSLGRDSDDGQWVTVTRNLNDDLKKLEPDNEIVAVNGILIQGSGMVDDIVLSDSSGEALPTPVPTSIPVPTEDDRDGDGISNETEIALGMDPEKIEPLPGTSSEERRDYHILSRFSYGINAELLKEVQAQGGAESWLFNQLNHPVTEYDEQERAQKMMDGFRTYKHEGKYIFPVIRPMHSERQLQTIMGVFWSNHFNTAGINLYEEVDDADNYYLHGLGNFYELLLMSAKSPAMLRYLDGRLNKKDSLNENYAREVMELHTLGVEGYNKEDGYTHADILSLAKILSGWGYLSEDNQPHRYGWYTNSNCDTDYTKNDVFAFSQNNHDESSKIFLGKTYRNEGLKEGEDALKSLAEHPRTASFICSKLAKKFVSDNPVAQTIEACSERFLANKESDTQIAEALKALIESEEFKNSGGYRCKAKDTQEYLLSLGRLLELNATKYDGTRVGSETLDSIGHIINKYSMQPFYGQADPTGWYEVSSYWIKSDTTFDRMQWANRISHEIKYGRDSLKDFFADKGLTTPKKILDYLLPIMTGGYYAGKDVQKSYDILCGDAPQSCDISDKTVRNLMEYLSINAEFNLQ